MSRTVGNGGGNLPVGPIEFKLGGNAANLAVALARLGARVDLITQTDGLGRFLLERAAAHSGLNIRAVEVGAHASGTLALEFGDANLMLSHAGPLQEFGPDRLTSAHWRLIDEADAVAVVNWAQNHQGTELLERVARRASRHDAFVYVDTADPRHRGPLERGRLLRNEALWRSVDAWSLNENEVRAFMRRTGEPIELARRLSRRLGVRLDLHTRRLAASILDEDVVKVPASSARPRRLTGAGDAWNAGNLAGYLLGWQAQERLEFAHLVANRYVTAESGLPPAAKELAPPSRTPQA